MKEYKNLLSCWHKLEHFSPAPVPKGDNVSELKDIVPWEIPLKSKSPEKTLEYTIYLGVFDSNEVNEFVKKYFEDSSKDEEFRNSQICFASLNLDIEGKYINDSFGISTLPWALSQLEKDKIKSDNWAVVFENIKEELLNYIELNFKETITNSQNEVEKVCKIINQNQLIEFQEKIESAIDWSIKPKTHNEVKRIEKFKPKKNIDNKPSADILNSFYIKDLEKITEEFDAEKSPKAFLDYLKGSLNNKSERIDISKTIDSLKQNLTPSNYPDGCWPSDFTLNLMQQYAVNNIFNQLSENNQEGIFSVNGPPGTGKTTLLRDIISPIIVKRAKELINVKNPSDAFTKVGSLEINEKYSPWIYAPLESLCNAGIVVASSNNGAVENISKELPLKEQVSSNYNTHIEYFKSVAENCKSPDNWGIISAALGNKQNRTDFINTLWFDFDNKQKIGLQKALDEDKLYDNIEWDKTKILFTVKLEEVSKEKERLENFKIENENYAKTKGLYFVVVKDLENKEKEFLILKNKVEEQIGKVFNLDERKKEIINELVVIKSSKPSFFSYWLSSKKRKNHKNAIDSALNIYTNTSEELALQNSILVNLETDLNNLESLKEKYQKEKISLQVNLKILTDKTDKAKTELKYNYADADFWLNIESQKSQESCPWYSNKLRELQSELFILALKLNEVFILTANSSSSRISTTLAAFFEYLKGDLTAPKKEIKAMWDTFFLVIPVISSTFASIQTMFKHLEKADIPWLFVDEAGQAIPQAAVGAIWRSKRVVVVGDPFQIEPVVTIPNSITDNISNYFELNKNQVSSELSVQSMADRINPLGSYLTFDNKEQWIGIPLRIHRRCINPMFELSNSIAYNNTMFCSTRKPEKVSVNFKTSFIDCKGKVIRRHFVQEQAEIIKNILVNEIAFNKNLPDIFVITPFSEISFELNSFLFKFLINEAKKHREINSEIMGEWLKTHVGTVHTFQGKQAEGVILCLGLDEKTKGAASWASKKPNLLNVALTRAKYRFIAIGDKDIWFKYRHFNELKKLNE